MGSIHRLWIGDAGGEHVLGVMSCALPPALVLSRPRSRRLRRRCTDGTFLQTHRRRHGERRRRQTASSVPFARNVLRVHVELGDRAAVVHEHTIAPPAPSERCRKKPPPAHQGHRQHRRARNAATRVELAVGANVLCGDDAFIAGILPVTMAPPAPSVRSPTVRDPVACTLPGPTAATPPTPAKAQEPIR